MEVTTLTTFLAPFLPYLLNPGKGTSETATNKFGEASWQKAQTVWAVLKPKVDAKESAKEAAMDVAKNPDDEDSQTVLRVQLKKLVASDEALSNQLAGIFQVDSSSSMPTTQITQNVKGNQNQTIGQISGGQVFGNVTGSVIISGSGNSVASAYGSASSSEPASPKAPDADVKTILVLAANPKNTSQLRLGEEVREIQAGLERSQYRDRVRIEQRWAVRPRDVQRAFLDTHPLIVHFSGHGEGVASPSNEPGDARKAVVVSEGTGDAYNSRTQSEGLLLEDEVGKAQLVSTRSLANLFSLFSDEVECVVLNACYSATQAEAIAQHIPYVVGMKKAIGDRAAIKFSLGFYDGLLANRPVDFAYKLGCNAIDLESIPEHLTPVLKKKRKEAN